MKSLTQIAYDNLVAGGMTGADAKDVIRCAAEIFKRGKVGTFGEAIEQARDNLLRVQFHGQPGD